MPPSRQARTPARGPTYSAPVPGRPEQRLVAGKGEQVDVHRLHVDRHDAGRLGGIHQEEQVALAGDVADLGDRLHGAEDVAGVGQGDEPRLRRDGLADGVGIDGAAAVGLDARQADAAGQFHRPQRPADAVVFQVGGDDVVAVLQHALERHVEGVGAVEREDEALRALRRGRTG